MKRRYSENRFLLGRLFFNFQTVYESLIAEDAAVVCDTEALIAESVIRFLSSRQEQEEAGQRAQEEVVKHQGALQKTVSLIEAIYCQ